LLAIDVATICFFDRDYRCIKEVDEFIKNMKLGGLECLVLGRKEIENFLVCPRAITAAVNKRLERGGKSGASVSESAIYIMIEAVFSDNKNGVSAQIVSNELRFEREHNSREDDSTIIARAIAEFEQQWSTFDGRRSLTPGKDVLRRLFDQLQKIHGVSITTAAIQEEMNIEEIELELAAMLRRADGFFNEDVPN
jgi:hypothetical protein